MTHPGGDEGRREGLVGEERVDPKVLATAEVLDLVALLPALHAAAVDDEERLGRSSSRGDGVATCRHRSNPSTTSG